MAQAKQIIAREKIDVMMINTPIPDEFGVDSALDIVSQNPVCVLLLVKMEQYEKVAMKVRGTGILVITRPLKAQSLLEAAGILDAMSVKLSAMAKENQKLRRRIDELGLVTRAKCLLIEKKGMKESEAHYTLERMAMDQSLTKKEVAQRIIGDLAAD